MLRIWLLILSIFSTDLSKAPEVSISILPQGTTDYTYNILIKENTLTVQYGTRERREQENKIRMRSIEQEKTKVLSLGERQELEYLIKEIDKNGDYSYVFDCNDCWEIRINTSNVKIRILCGYYEKYNKSIVDFIIYIAKASPMIIEPIDYLKGKLVSLSGDR